ncbi:MAG: right-handed parallel beta-helix repeat-containing protein [Acidobacteria bacterium]|nr:right-handed parallel beta-helix repeat-containing protein [Acidobacteriota bacterium]
MGGRTRCSALFILLMASAVWPRDGVPARAESAAAPRAAVYHVAVTGDDANPGTASQPWRTLGKAADTLTAGDTVLIGPGTYAERLTPAHSGTPGNYITFAAAPGAEAVLDGATVDVPEWGALVDLSLQSWIRVSGLRVINTVSNVHNPGILADTSSHILIDGNRVSNTTDSGIAAWNSTDVVVERNEVHDVCTGGFNESITIGNSSWCEVRFNHVHHGAKEGICLKDGATFTRAYGNRVHHTGAVCYYVDAQARPTSDIEVFGNVAHDGVENGFSIASEVGGLLERVKVYNNLAWRNGWVGIHISDCCVADHPMSDIRVVNNTVVGNGTNDTGWGGGIAHDNPQAAGVVIRNNLCSQNLSFQIAVAPTVPAGAWVADHNLIDGFRDSEGEIWGDDPRTGDPLFLLASAGDFHTGPGSPAAGGASSTDLPVADFDGVPRPAGAGPDIGAWETLTALPARGDLDGDDRVTAVDRLALQLLNAGTLSALLAPCRFPSAADLDGNGTLDAADEDALARLLSGTP